MKTITLKVNFDEQKRAALAQFLTKKGLTLEDEAAAFLQKLYERSVSNLQVKERMPLTAAHVQQTPTGRADRGFYDRHTF